MNKSLSIIFIIFLLAPFASCKKQEDKKSETGETQAAESVVEGSENLIRITNGEWEPFLSEYCDEYGLASHIVSEAFKLEKIDIKWGFFPWKRSYEVAKMGAKWDASAVWWPTPEARNDFLISEPVVGTSFVFFHLKSSKFQWKSMKDLKGLTIGFTRGYDYGKEFMAALKKKQIKVETVSSDEQSIRMLLAGRIDLFPNDPIVGYSQIRNSLSPEKANLITNHPKKFGVNTLNLFISKKCKNGEFFLNKFNSGLKKLKSSGKIKLMYKDLDAGKYDKKKNKFKAP
ncbi:MAG: ABC transporter substrate-binding protein [bacterium]|nr:ABC transporter substrate-binding protein [bacterium]